MYILLICVLGYTTLWVYYRRAQKWQGKGVDWFGSSKVCLALETVLGFGVYFKSNMSFYNTHFWVLGFVFICFPFWKMADKMVCMKKKLAWVLTLFIRMKVGTFTWEQIHYSWLHHGKKDGIKSGFKNAGTTQQHLPFAFNDAWVADGEVMTWKVRSLIRVMFAVQMLQDNSVCEKMLLENIIFSIL